VCSRIGLPRASPELLRLTKARAILDDGVKVAGLVLDAVVVVVEMVDIGHVVMVQVCSFQGLAATEILFTAECILVRAWLVLLSINWHLGWSASEWPDLGRSRGA